ncbi:MAG: DNA-processing protein DprA [Reichenbachiella sp.]|uniref:DNA-processing protein DprA n=1 Tax=Reichenbachiella sp. TaxID=2184521 RepID=UPI003298DFA9
METLSLEDSIGILNIYESKNAPNKLFFEGNLSYLSSARKVSVVGSRKATKEGIKRAAIITELLISKGIIVVSGLAEGIDTIAHTTTIQKGGQTITVLGTPLNKTYPKKNEHLLQKIKNEHLAVSQFPKDHPVQPKNFIMRNHTMALISDATIIVEAGEKSGSRYQGWETLRLGRELFLLESLANDPKLSWPKEMIKYGAKVLTRNSITHFLDDLPEFTTSKNATF